MCPTSQRKKHKEKSIFDLGLETASDAMSIGVKLAKGTVKGAVDLAANKHVAEYQIYGKWRFMQEIEVKNGVFISCPATIEFVEDGTVVTLCDGQKYESEYVFKERPWPRKCSIYFQARAFQGPKDQEPVNMFYKGYFKRSIMNPNVLLIRGKIYKLAGKMFLEAATQGRYIQSYEAEVWINAVVVVNYCKYIMRSHISQIKFNCFLKISLSTRSCLLSRDSP